MADVTINSNKVNKSWWKSERGFLIFALLMVLFPFVLNAFTGTGLNEGITKFWQGQMIIFSSWLSSP